MNSFLVIFLILCASFIAIKIVALVRRLYITKERKESEQETPEGKAKHYVGLSVAGLIPKHIIVNFSTPRDDDAQYKKYATFLSKRNVETIKKIQGDDPFV